MSGELSDLAPAKAACGHFSGYPMATFVTAAQWLLPFCIKHIMKQTHLLLHWCFWGEAIDLLLPPVWLQPHVLETGWSRSYSCLPVCSLVKGDKGVESVRRREEVSASFSDLPGIFKGVRETRVVRVLELEGNSYISGKGQDNLIFPRSEFEL